MEQELQFIQNQIWFLIGLIFLLITTNVICYFLRKSESTRSPGFGDMWEKGQIHELVEKTREYLIESPNHAGALYFGAKALVAKRENLSEARGYLAKLLENEPTLKESVQNVIDEINEIEGS